MTDDDPFLRFHLPGTSQKVTELRRQVVKLNQSRNLSLIQTILIRGESGSGKNHLARVIAAHRKSLEITAAGGNRGMATGLATYLDSFDEIHLPALPDTLVESELFGHKKGAFTGAAHAKTGLLSDAADHPKSDILLDEIGDASPALQAKLLQVLETRKIRPIGAEPGDEEETSARIMLATNRVLEDDIAKGRFREDLYWRIMGFSLQVPTVREQPENIAAIAKQILSELTNELPIDPDSQSSQLSLKELSWAKEYPWPGNVREIRAALMIWAFENGKVELGTIVESMPKLGKAVLGRANKSDYVKNALESGTDLGSLDELIRRNNENVKGEIIEWFDLVRPIDSKLRLMFSMMKPRSFRQKISDWRKGR